MKKVLFVCWYNSARSQMAEGLLRDLGGDSYDVYSAGIEAGELRPQAVEVMKEIGIDISAQQSKTTERYIQDGFDEVITVCDSAQQACPVFPNAKHRLHWSVEDPDKVTGTEQEVLDAFREARDSLKSHIELDLLSKRT